MVQFVVLGGAGYVSTAFSRYLLARGSRVRVVSRAEVDYSNFHALRDFLRTEQPDFLINAAGYTGKPNVDACEADKANCLFGNAVLPGRIAEVCESLHLPWGHVSSGCIYTGARPDGSGFTEKDAPNFSFRQNNCSFYSGTKALGEEVLAGRPDVFIWRLRIPFNEIDGPRNYLSKVMRYDRLLQAENSISQLDELVRACVETWERRVPFGIYNVTNPGSITTRDVVDLILESGLSRKEYQFFDTEADFMAEAAIAPRSNCVMSSQKLAALGIHLTPVREAIRQALANWRPEAPKT